MNDEAPASGPLSWRDVYRAVERAEDQILVEMHEGFDAIRGVVENHEGRIHAVELSDAREAGFLAGEAKIFGLAKSTLTILIALGSVAFTVAGLLLR